MKVKLSVLNDIWLLPDAKKAIQELVVNDVVFPEERDVPEVDLIQSTGTAEAILFSPHCNITSSYLSSCPSVKYLGLCGTSATNVDMDSVRENNLSFSNVIDYGDEPAAEYMFMHLLKLARGDGKYQWQKNPRELMGKSIGIIGLGALGKSVANLALGFKMKVSYFSPHRIKNIESRGVVYKEKQELLKTNQIFAITSPSDVKVLEKDEFGLIGENSILMYLSGGEAIDEEAFLDWIQRNDNYAIFNYSAGERYYKIFSDVGNVIFPKVIAGLSIETRQRLGMKVVENLEKYMMNRNHSQ